MSGHSPSNLPCLTAPYPSDPLDQPVSSRSYLIIPNKAVPDLTVPYLILPYLIIFSLAVPYVVIPNLAVPYLIIPHLTVPYLIIPYLTVPHSALPHLNTLSDHPVPDRPRPGPPAPDRGTGTGAASDRSPPLSCRQRTPSCRTMNECLTAVSRQQPLYKFCKLRASTAGVSKQFVSARTRRLSTM